jgi:hypothetical protein
MGGGYELSMAEEPIDKNWTVNVVDTSICPSCGVHHAK